jgi:hypothetical protein
MSKSRARGTRTENEHLDKYLSMIWPEVERAAPSGINDAGDFINTDGYLIESKYRSTTKAWRIAQWALVMMAKAIKHKPEIGWLIIVSADKRKNDGFPIDLVVMPAEQYFKEELMR